MWKEMSYYHYNIKLENTLDRIKYEEYNEYIDYKFEEKYVTSNFILNNKEK